MTSRRHSGMGLVELLVWVAVSLLIITIIGAIYLNTKQLTRVNDTVSRLQENGRFVIHLLDRDVRMAGFRGCNGASVTPLNALNSNAYAYQFNEALAGYHGANGAWVPSLDASISTLIPPPVDGTDVVTIRHIDGPGVPLTVKMTNSSSFLTVAAGSPLATGDVVLVADCSAAAVFNVTSFDAGSCRIAHDTAGATVPGNNTDDLNHVFSTDASVYRLVTRTYYIGASVRKPGSNALWSSSTPAYDGQPQPEEMVEGVEGVSLYFGEDTDGDRAANRYVTADAIGNWGNVVSVKAQLLLTTVRDNVTTSPQPYNFAGVATTPTDRRMRSVLSSVITVRNRVP
jgi:type IV pilus assembly protein PilW